MSLIYITGVEGAGKSTICEQLREKGLNAIDIDKSRLTRRYFKGTWQLSPSLPEGLNPTADWYQEREWKIKPGTITDLRNNGDNHLIFLCGITDNFNEIKNLFDKVICLTLERKDVVSRLKARTNNNFGKNMAQQMYILDKHEDYESMNLRHGSVMIDASQPLSKVVNDVIAASTS